MSHSSLLLTNNNTNAGTMLMIYIILIPAAVAYTKCPVKPETSCGQNATYIDCPSACPSTCKSPNEGNCNKKCKPKGCHCNPSYLLSKRKGHCILPKDCPGGNPCPQNETFVSCNIRCPNSYCPVDDSLAILICDPPQHCPSGCSCKPNYRRKSVKDPRCILASECPPVKCTRPNEEWNPCTTSCLKENCYDLKANDTACKPWGCKPRCACKEDYYRNDSGICVPASECFPAETCDIPSECRRTCAEPNPENCAYQTATENVKGCKCMPGYILSDKDGECIEIEKCPPAPPPIKCGVNEEYSKCKITCPPQFCNISYTDYGVCPNETKCEPGCNCIKDHLRNFEGKCVLNDNCPPPPTPTPTCGDNATAVDCGSACPPTCQTPKPEICTFQCILNSCQCKPSYILSEPNGECILPKDCPAAPPPTKCGVNEEYSKCKITCPPQFCNISYTDYGVCPNETKCEPGCNCIKDHLRNFEGKCVLNDNCPPPPPTCGGNATAVECASACPPTCHTPKPEACIALCKPNVTCQCKPYYVLSPNGDCILPKDCPAPPPVVCGENEVATVCKKTCQSDSCDSDNKQAICRPGPCRPGCNCKENYARDSNGKCIPKEQCPKKPSTCGGNATLVNCASSCPPTCQKPKPGICTAVCNPNGCQCKPSYILSKPKGECILPVDCPAPPPIVVCGENEVETVCEKTCPPDSCDCDSKQGVCKPGPRRRGCTCKEHYARDSNGKCIPKELCPKKPVICGGNSTSVDCASSCPPTCETPKPEACIDLCKPNVTCQCKPSYVLSPNGDCILPEDCPVPPPVVCGKNEVATVCKTRCSSDSCDFDSKQDICIPGPCRRGCNCKENYARDSNGKCIPKEQCPKKPTACGGNATLVDCASSCPPTCGTPKPEACTDQCKPNVTCQCKPSYVLSPSGDCILPEDCPEPITCGGNATLVDCATSCPPTCQSPNPRACTRQCNTNKCQCKPSYILSKTNGECILPKDCPGGNPCPQNETFVSCKMGCPNYYCPVDDRLATVMCDPLHPCPSGCSCKLNYKRKSLKDPQCILAEECPPVQCTRPNEEWNACPTSCLKENCEDLNLNTACKPSRTNCEPRCACKEGFYRNASRICVPASECFPKTCDIPDECKPTCSDPNPKNCRNRPATENVEGCKCKPGFILSDKNGECIRIEECPTESGCNGDSNAFITKCPPPCPSTCESPNESPCKKKCLSVGCKCKDGFILSELNGVCIKPDNCTGGNPCKNGAFSSCINKCPYNYCPVDDSPPNYNCSVPEPCPSGCICRFNYRKKSMNNDQCILASDCPPVKCTRPNEVWDSCPSACLREDCDDAGKEHSVCYPLLNNCQPRCICKPNTYKDKNKVCVPVDQCPTKVNEVDIFFLISSTLPNVRDENEVETSKFDDDSNAEGSVCNRTCDCKMNYSRDSNGKCVPVKQPPSKTCDIPPECRRTCAEPNPKNYSYQEVSENEDGCKCKPGFILLDKEGKCVKIENCPSQMGCNGDVNAVVTQCPPPCPSTCSSPNEVLCKKACQDVGCKCKEGYILSELNGLCIPPEECKGGNPCGKNATFLSCSNKCSYNYCPKDDSPPNYNCSIPSRCPSGCVCNLNYRRKSINDEQCILASECPPINCTRPNEVWDPCPPDCLQERCEDAGKESVPCNSFVKNSQPQCICKKNTFRNKDYICVPVNECPNKALMPYGEEPSND